MARTVPRWAYRQIDPTQLPRLDQIAIVILGKDHPDRLGTLLEGLRRDDPEARQEVRFVDNSAREENRAAYRKLCALHQADYRPNPSPFNYSEFNNQAAQGTTRDFLIFLNDDMEVLTPGWSTRLVTPLLDPCVGIVGACLLYPDRETVQHAGVAWIENGPSHLLVGQRIRSRTFRPWFDGAFRVTAVTGACLALRAETFHSLGGFDTQLPLNFNDVDLCLRAARQGLSVIVDNRVRLVHHESLTRGQGLGDRTKRQELAASFTRLRDAHPGRDEPYNRAFHPHRVDFLPNLPRFWGSRFRLRFRRPAPPPPSPGEVSPVMVDEVRDEGRTVYLRGHLVSKDRDLNQAPLSLVLPWGPWELWFTPPRYPRVELEFLHDLPVAAERLGFFVYVPKGLGTPTGPFPFRVEGPVP